VMLSVPIPVVTDGGLGGEGSMSIAQWFRALDAALIYVERGIAPSSTAYVRIF